MFLNLVVAAHAHEPGLSRLDVAEGSVAWASAAADALDPALLRTLEVTRGGEPCALGPTASSPTEGDGVEARAPLTCAADGPTEVRASFLAALPPGHRLLVESGGEPVGWLDAAHPTLTLSASEPRPSTGRVALEYVHLGVEHIVTGWDHLLFLGGLLLGVRTLREAALVVTGFTVAHSITLALAATGLVAAPSWLVEPAIALTVVWVGVENLLAERPARRVALTTALGLIHGLGFAGLLAELGLPREHLLTALLAFNGGVELGQFVIVLLALPILQRLRTLADGRVLKAASVLVSVVGLVWFVERVTT